MEEEDHLEVAELAALEEGEASYLEVAYQGGLGVAYLALVDLIDSLEVEACPA